MTDLKKTLEERGKTHGSIECNARVTQELVALLEGEADIIEGVPYECLRMICHKMSRVVCGTGWNPDNAHDIAGYATLLEKWMEEQNEKL